MGVRGRGLAQRSTRGEEGGQQEGRGVNGLMDVGCVSLLSETLTSPLMHPPSLPPSLLLPLPAVGGERPRQRGARPYDGQQDGRALFGVGNDGETAHGS